MYPMIERYMNMLKKSDVENFALSKNVHLNSEELDFTYAFVKKNWRAIIKNPNLFNIDRYKGKFSEENFLKVKQIYQEYFQKFSSFL